MSLNQPRPPPGSIHSLKERGVPLEWDCSTNFWPGLRQVLKLERRVSHKLSGEVWREVAYAITWLGVRASQVGRSDGGVSQCGDFIDEMVLML
jgi:hypothetical protein